MIRVNVCSTLLAIIALFYSQLSNAQQIDTRVDRTTLPIDEAVTLQVTVAQDMASNALDTRPLLKDFVVGRTQVRQSSQSFNGRASVFTQFTTVLFPRRIGEITIPSLNLGTLQTQPISLRVTKADQTAAQDIFIRVEADQNQVYVQQQVTLTAKLYIATQVQRGGLQPPEMEGAEITVIGDQKEYTEELNGKRYSVIEYQFAVTPLNSGEFELRGPTFNAEVVVPGSAGSGLFRSTRKVYKSSAPVPITVLPVPQGFNGQWLPSEFVSLDESWSVPLESLKVGEPVTRTLKLSAVGVSQQQLPEINSSYPPQINAYPEASVTSAGAADGNMISQRTRAVTLIPSQAGLTVLPEVQVSWFNTQTQQMENAVLPARSITIQPADTSAPPPPTVPAVSTPKPDPDVQSEATLTKPVEWYWRPAVAYAIAGAFLLGWIATLMLLLKRHKTPAVTEVSQQSAAPGLSTLETRLHTALVKNNATQASQLIGDYLALLLNRPNQPLATSLQQISDKRLSQLISELFAVKYGQSSGQGWQGGALASQLKALRKSRREKRPPEALPRLYPD